MMKTILDVEAWRKFMARLLEPPKELPRLKKLLNHKPIWETTDGEQEKTET